MQVPLPTTNSSPVRGLNTHEINQILRRSKVTGKSYLGCFPSNLLPVPKFFPCSMVANTDDSTKPGTHWVAIYAHNKHTVSYFDSIDGPDIPNIEEFLKKNFVRVIKQKYTIQRPKSKVCGYYVIFFIWMLSAKYTYRFIEQILTNTPDPDKYVVMFVNKYIVKNKSR